MRYKNVSSASNQILSYFNRKDQMFFTFSEAMEAMPNSSHSALKQLLSDMAKRGLLLRLRRGLYCLIPFEKDADLYMPNWHLAATYLSGSQKHYIGYYSALQIHDLISQPALKEQIVIAKQMRPSLLKIKDVAFQFIYHNENHFFGYQKVWIDNYHQVYCSDLEKTLVDCLFKPEYAGGIVEVAKAIYLSRKAINFDKLLDYTIRFKSQAVIKRLGFLLDLLEINTDVISSLQSLRTSTYSILDTELPKSGKRISRWRIQQNLDRETILSAIYT
ncbi:MAG: type IV toxin-antitoxin system AbiEi family antitoxin domain-containing protein [Bacteroidetes bacterium]|nr:type IV toxin-antitoxin system AbiEi family antitoxin domain-containing protein [Bacteroidota bacterium]